MTKKNCTQQKYMTCLQMRSDQNDWFQRNVLEFSGNILRLEKPSDRLEYSQHILEVFDAVTSPEKIII